VTSYPHRRGAGSAVLFRRILLATFAVLAACASTPPPPAGSAYQAPTVVGKATTLAPPAMDPDAEIGLLARTKTPAALLRVAWLHLQQRRPQNALDAVAEVLYGPTKPSSHEESFARYLRAEAFAAAGAPERGSYDRDLARQLAIDPELRKLLGPKIAPAAAAEAPPAAGLELAVQPRSQWKAAPHDPGNVEPMAPIHRVTIHHSAMYFRDTRPSTCAAQIQAIQRQHMTANRWGDIGYHFLIDPSGRIWQGRALRFQGAHAFGASNVGNVGICLLGNFMRNRRGKERGQEPTRPQLAAMRQLVAELMRVHNFGADAIYCHHDFKDTECPGELMTPLVGQMVRDFRRNGAGEQ
jgi:hypothetical protein